MFSKRQGPHVLVDDALDLHWLHDVGDELRMCVGVSDLIVKQSSDAALRRRKKDFTHSFKPASN